MRWAYSIVTPATLEVLSLEEAKAELDVYHNDDDVMISQHLEAAIGFVQDYTNTFLAPTLVELQADKFDPIIELPLGPVVEPGVVSVQYGLSGVNTPFTNFVASGQRIAPAYGYSWPSPSRELLGSVLIRFWAGYADGQVPPQLLQALKLAMRAFYEAPSGPQLEAELEAARAVARPLRLGFM